MNEKQKLHLKDIRHRIREGRLNRSLSQGQMAELLGVSRPFYNQLETGKRLMSLTRLMQIAELLRISLSTLTKQRTVILESNDSDAASTDSAELIKLLDDDFTETEDDKKSVLPLPADAGPHHRQDGQPRRPGYTVSPSKADRKRVRHSDHASWTYHTNAA